MCPHKVDVNVKFDLNAIQNIAQHRRAAIEQCIDALTHSCLCHDAFCRRTTCTKMKRVVIHTSICKRKLKGNCPICRQLIALCCYHAKNCRIDRCAVPFCNTVKLKLRQQHLMLERVDAARGLGRAGAAADPDESDAIDVNMSGAPVFGDDAPSGSDTNVAEPDANGSSNVCTHGHAIAGPSSSDQPGPSGMNTGPCELCRAGQSGENTIAGDQPGPSGSGRPDPSGVGEQGSRQENVPEPSGGRPASPAGLSEEDMREVNIVHIQEVRDNGSGDYFHSGARGASYAIAIEINNIAYPLYAVRDIAEAAQSRQNVARESDENSSSSSGAGNDNADSSKHDTSTNDRVLVDDIACER